MHKDWNEDLVHSFTVEREQEMKHFLTQQRDELDMDAIMSKLNPISSEQERKQDITVSHSEEIVY